MTTEHKFHLDEVVLPNPTKSIFAGLRCVDLCSGMGGFSTAAKWLGMEPVAAMDTWEMAEEAYTANFPDATFVRGDLCKKPFRQKVVDAVGNEGCDVLLAGPPCQGFSQMLNGQRKKRDPRNQVMHAVPKAITELRPRLFVVENVPALLPYDGGQFARRLLDRIAAPAPGLSYDVHHAIVDAALLGVPQQRRRLVVIGVERGEGSVAMPKLPNLAHYFSGRRRGAPLNGFSSEIGKILANPDDDRMVTVSQATSDLPILAAGQAEKRRPYRTEASNPYQRRVRGGNGPLTGTGTPRIQEKTMERLQALEPGRCVTDLPSKLRHGLKRRYMSAYRRLHPDLPATTLFTKIDCAYHHSEPRALSVREYARMQSIPDSYTFPVAARNAYAMIGNAVPPLMVARLLTTAVDLN